LDLDARRCTLSIVVTSSKLDDGATTGPPGLTLHDWPGRRKRRKRKKVSEGVELAEQICQAESLDSALTGYDASSITRSKSAIRMSHWSITVAHAQGWKLTLYVLLLRIVRLLFI
jgi:hypothetical protein